MFVFERGCVRACVCARAHMCVCMCVRARARVYAHVCDAVECVECVECVRGCVAVYLAADFSAKCLAMMACDSEVNMCGFSCMNERTSSSASWMTNVRENETIEEPT